MFLLEIIAALAEICMFLLMGFAILTAFLMQVRLREYRDRGKEWAVTFQAAGLRLICNLSWIALAFHAVAIAAEMIRVSHL